MDLFGPQIVAEADALFQRLAILAIDDQIEVINQIKTALHKVSPFREEPTDCVLWVPGNCVEANTYNPNVVAPPEMRLLMHSIQVDGYTQPIVTMAQGQTYTVVDGFHRSRIGKESKVVRERLHGHLPVTVINTARNELRDRMAATIRHNRARGVHGITPMTEVVRQLIVEGWTDADICKEIGMDPDEILRFKQTTGLAELFKDRDYSRSWE